MFYQSLFSNMDEQKGYQFTKLVLMNDTADIENDKTRRLIWIMVIVLALAFSISSSYFILKTFYSPAYEESASKSKAGSILSDDSSKISKIHKNLSLFNEKIWIVPRNRERIHEHPSGLLCGVVPEQFQAIHFDIFLNKTTQTHLTDMHDLINMNLFLYYESVINKQPIKNLKILFAELQKKLSSVSKPEDFIDFLKSLNLNEFKFYTTYLQNKFFYLEMSRFEYFFHLTDELHSWYNYLDGLHVFLSHYEQQKFKGEFNLHVSKKNFGEFVQETQKRWFPNAYNFQCTEKKLKEINEMLNEWMKPLEVKITGPSVTIYNKVVLTSEVNSQFINFNTSIVENLSVIASHTVYLDEDLNLPGVNFAIMAPRWVFLKKIKINLSGLSGKNHETEEAEEGRPGKPGNPGGNAGDFLGVGDFIEKFLYISTNGGRGGDGQNGAMGRVGANNTRPLFTMNKPSCLYNMGSIKNHLNQTITHYKIFSEIGCGGSGTDGGVGGEGGYGGRVILINKQTKPKITQGVNGAGGIPGKGGKGGKGGRNGCFYEVLDEDDEVLHLVTLIKCRENILPSGNPGRDGQNNKSKIYPPIKRSLLVSDCLLNFFEISSRDFIKHNDSILISFFKQLNLLHQNTNTTFVLKLLNIFENLGSADLYELYKNKIDEYSEMMDSKNHETINYLRVIVLGNMLILKPNINYMFINYNSYLHTLQRNIENIKREGVQPISIIGQNVARKFNTIRRNLGFLKSKLKILDGENNKIVENFLTASLDEKNVLVENITRSLSFALQERRILSVLLTLLDVTDRFMKLTQNPLKGDEVKFQNFVKRIMVSSEALKRSKDDFFDKVESLSPEQKEILSELALCTNEYKGNVDIFKKVALFVSKLSRNEKIPLGIWENLILTRGQLAERVKGTLVSIMESDAFSAEGKTLLEALTDEVDHFLAIYYHVERQSLEKLFLESLNALELKSAHNESRDIKNSKSHLYEVIINLQYSLAVDATQVKLLPLSKIERRLHPSSDITNEALKGITRLETMTKPICGNNHEALFDKDSTVGEFYFWPNSKIRSKLENLFSGDEINLKADLNNRHALVKNFIKFKSLKVDFECGENVNSSLYEILSHFQVEMTHSGYSYYNWRGDTLVIVSDEATFRYGLKERHGQPELYNDLYKKLQSDDVLLSPYTSWKIRLLPITSGASYEKLIKFANVVDLRLVGVGIFTTD